MIWRIQKVDLVSTRNVGHIIYLDNPAIPESNPMLLIDYIWMVTASNCGRGYILVLPDTNDVIAIKNIRENMWHTTLDENTPPIDEITLSTNHFLTDVVT